MLAGIMISEFNLIFLLLLLRLNFFYNSAIFLTLEAILYLIHIFWWKHLLGLYFFWLKLFVIKLVIVQIGFCPIHSENVVYFFIFYYRCPMITGSTHKAPTDIPTQLNPDNFRQPNTFFLFST